MTHEEAATRLESSLPRMRETIETAKKLHMAWDEVTKDIECIELAARVLRSVASASADAEKSCDDFCDQQDDNFWCEKHRNIVEKTYRHAYLAGHAAATAAMQAEVDALNDTLNLTRGMLEQARETKERAARLATMYEKQSEQKDADIDAMCDEVERMDVLLLNFHSNPTLYAHEAIKAHAEIDNNRPPRVTEILAARKEKTNEPQPS